MSRSSTVAATIAVGFLICGATGASSRGAGRRPTTTALICTYQPAQQSFVPMISVVAGPLAGRGWIRSARAGWLLHKGDRLSLYAMESGLMGALEVIGPAAPPEDQNWSGSLFSVREDITAHNRAAYDAAVKRRTGKEPWLRMPYLLAAWDASGRPPRWVRSETVDPHDARYRAMIVNWLAQRGVPRDARLSMEIKQIVRADLNGDGRREELLSFHSPDLMTPTWPSPVTKHRFSYLVLRSPGSPGKPPTMRVLAEYGETFLTVNGFCDLDRDGWAEIVVSRDSWEDEDLELMHWNGRAWRTIAGWGSGL